jgi:membrane protein
MIRVFLTSFVQAWNDNVPRLAASLAFYTLFAFAPTVLVAAGIAGAISGDPGVREQLVAQITGLVGEQGGRAVRALVESGHGTIGWNVAALTGLLAFVLAATGAFLELQAALDTIWRVTPAPGLNLGGFVKDRLRSFALMVGVGLLLLASLAASASLTFAGAWLSARVPQAPMLLGVANIGSSIALTGVLFAMLFKFVPDVHLRWRDVAAGAVFTALLFAAGEYLIGLYLGLTATSSSYGAAGSVVLLLLWVYYSAQVFLIGAEFTRLHAQHRGVHAPCQDFAEPEPHSSPVPSPQARA